MRNLAILLVILAGLVGSGCSNSGSEGEVKPNPGSSVTIDPNYNQKPPDANRMEKGEGK